VAGARPWRHGALAASAALAWGSGALAEAAPDAWRSTEYYVGNGALIGALIVGGALTDAARGDLEAGGDAIWFPGDAGLRGECSPQAAHLSDTSLALAVGLPVGMQLGLGLDARFVNAEIVYSETLLANRLLTSAAKVLFRRPRPFSYRKDPTCAFDRENADAYMSFFSGHSSTSFAAAVAGSLLMSETGLDRDTRSAIWGAEFALAGATANLRARAGKHYYSDILVGALVGSGIGVAVPLLHGADELPAGSDLLAGAIGLVIGVGGSQLIALGAEAIDENATPSVSFGPLPFAGSVGAQAVGVF
jgi:hypothetical protein